jgi:hypothetical protein
MGGVLSARDQPGQARDQLVLHESGTYVKFAQAGAAMIACWRRDWKRQVECCRLGVGGISKWPVGNLILMHSSKKRGHL